MVSVLSDQFDKAHRYTALGLTFHGCHLLIEGTFPLITRTVIASNHHRQMTTIAPFHRSTALLGVTVVATSITSAIAAALAGPYITPALGAGRLRLRDCVAISIRSSGGNGSGSESSADQEGKEVGEGSGQ